MIYFVGAGPGDPDLISVKGRKLLEDADMVIYAGSLVSSEHLEYCKPGCEIYNSAEMTLEQVTGKFREGSAKGYEIVRLHTGDPTIYGAIREQMDVLSEMGLEFKVIPGISSFTAAAATINREFTLPNVSQTVILTRQAGRTPVPESENLVSLARHGASMAIFLSAGNIEEVARNLKKGYGRGDVPCAVIYRATWKDEKCVFGTLADIAEKVKEAGIRNHAQILVGDFLGTEYDRSQLYHPKFGTAFRKAEK